MTSKKISVIIPAYNGGDTLFEVLAGFERQTYPVQAFEVLVVDDCSTDDTWARLQAFAEHTSLSFRLLQQTVNLGVSSTRNLGATNATGDLLLFVDQDCLPAPDLIEQHLLAHQKYAERKVAVAGRIIWSPEFGGSEAQQFYKDLYFPAWEGVSLTNAPFYYFVTSNASVPRQGLLEAGLFDAEFRHLYDDQIAGYRLQQHGYQLVLDEAAVVYHHRDLDVTEAINRHRRMGVEAARIVRKYPELVGILTEPGELLADSYMKQTLYRLLAQYAMAWGLTEGLEREFPDKALQELLEQPPLLKNFETWRDRRLELYQSEIASLRHDREQQLKYMRHLERAYHRQRDELKDLRHENLALADYAARLEAAQGLNRVGFNFGVLARNLLNVTQLARRTITRLRHTLT